VFERLGKIERFILSHPLGTKGYFSFVVWRTYYSLVWERVVLSFVLVHGGYNQLGHPVNPVCLKHEVLSIKSEPSPLPRADKFFKRPSFSSSSGVIGLNHLSGDRISPSVCVLASWIQPAFWGSIGMRTVTTGG